MTGLLEILELPLPRALGWALAHFAWQGAVVGVLLWAGLRSGFLRTPQSRYLASGFALAACVAAAVVTFTSEWKTATQPAFMGFASGAVTPTAAVSTPDLAPHDTAPIPRALAGGGGAAFPASWLGPVLPWLVLTWAVGVSLLSVRLLGMWAFTQHLKHRLLRPVPAWVGEKLVTLCGKLGIGPSVRVFESAAVECPAAIGWLRPVILLPASALTGLSASQLETILAHELAHIRRHDYLVNLLQSVAETALFFHPAVWWISSRIREERELCCDDIAVAACGNELEYAEALAALAQQRHDSAQFAMSAAGGSLLGRIQRILSGSGPAVPVSRPAAAFTGVLMISLLITVVAQAYMLHARKEKAPTAGLFADGTKGWPERYLRPVTMTWEKAPLSTIAAAITTQTGLVIPLPAGSEDEPLTVRFDGAPLYMALDAILTRARIGWRLVGNEQIVTTAWDGRAHWLARWRNEAKGRELDKDIFQAGYCSILYTAKDVPLATAMKVMGAQMGCRIAVPQAEAGHRVGFTFHNDFARDALAQVLGPLKLDYRVLGDSELEIYRP